MLMYTRSHCTLTEPTRKSKSTCTTNKAEILKNESKLYIWREAYVVLREANFFAILLLLAVMELVCREVMVACKAVEHSHDTPHLPEYAPPRDMLSSELCDVGAQLPVVIDLVQPHTRGGTASAYFSDGLTSSMLLLSYIMSACCHRAWKGSIGRTCCLLGTSAGKCVMQRRGLHRRRI